MSALVELAKASKKKDGGNHALAGGAIGATLGAGATARNIKKNPKMFVDYANHQLRYMGRKAAARKTVKLMAIPTAINAGIYGTGGAVVGSKIKKNLERLDHEGLDRASTYGRQAGARGRRIVDGEISKAGSAARYGGVLQRMAAGAKPAQSQALP